MNAVACRHSKNLFAALFLAVLTLALTGCQHGPYKAKSMTIAHTAPYEPGIEVRRAIRKECDLERRVAHEIAAETRGWFSAINRAPVANANSPGLALDLKIINVEGGPGAARGNKTLTVAGTLYEDGKVAGSFTATRRTKHGRHACRMFWENIEEIAEDVSRWMAAPRLNAYLGDARPGDFAPLQTPGSSLPR